MHYSDAKKRNMQLSARKSLLPPQSKWRSLKQLFGHTTVFSASVPIYAKTAVRVPPLFLRICTKQGLNKSTILPKVLYKCNRKC